MNTIPLNTKHIDVVTYNGMAHIYITIEDKPQAVWPFTGNLRLEFKSPESLYESYLSEHFPNIEYKVIKG